MKLTLKALSLAVLGAASTFTFAEEAPASRHTITGNIGVVSQYVLRGNTAGLENSGAAVQGGLGTVMLQVSMLDIGVLPLDIKSYAESGEQNLNMIFMRVSVAKLLKTWALK